MRMVTELRGISGFLGTTSLQLAFSPDHNWLALPDPTHDIVLWNLAEQREERRFKGARWHLNHVQFSVDGKQLAAGGWEGIAYVWNVADGQLAVPPLHGHGSGVMILGFSRDGRTLHTSGSENTIRLWSTATGVEMLRLNQAFIQDALWENDSLLRLTTSEWGTEPVLELVPSFAEIVAAEARVPMLTQP
jgi:WD40 repeat protein